MQTQQNNRTIAAMTFFGICPLLMKSTTLLTGAAMALTFLLVVLLSVISLSCCRRYVAYHFKLPVILMINVTVVFVLDSAMQYGWFAMRQTLGIYLPLLAMNSFLLLSLEQTAITTAPLSALRTVALPALLLAASVVLSGTLRELVGQGALLSDSRQLLGAQYQFRVVVDGGFDLFNHAAGAFLGLGLLIALVQFYTKREISESSV